MICLMRNGVKHLICCVVLRDVTRLTAGSDRTDTHKRHDRTFWFVYVCLLPLVLFMLICFQNIIFFRLFQPLQQAPWTSQISFREQPSECFSR